MDSTERKTVKKEVETLSMSEVIDELTPEQVIEKMQQLRQREGADTKLIFEVVYNDNWAIVLYKEYKETDEEYETRLKREREWELKRVEKELAELKRLQEKYYYQYKNNDDKILSTDDFFNSNILRTDDPFQKNKKLEICQYTTKNNKK